MWTYIWMSFTSHTFTSLPLVHTPNPDFLRRRLWLCFLLVRESPRLGNLRAPWLSNLTFSRFLNFTDSRFHGSAGSWLRVFMSLRLRSFTGSRFHIIARSRLRGFAGSGFQIFARSRLRGFAGSRFQIFARSRLRGFAGSRFQIFGRLRLCSFAGSRSQIFASSLFLKTHFTNFINLDVSRVTGFPEFPNRHLCVVISNFQFPTLDVKFVMTFVQ
jgi:hypothetical protein